MEKKKTECEMIKLTMEKNATRQNRMELKAKEQAQCKRGHRDKACSPKKKKTEAASHIFRWQKIV